MKTRAIEAGFTLVEIAIVLVIIGLLLGGILKGQELITSAKVRNLADQVSAVQAAYYGFVDRYRALPGDMSPGNACTAIGAAALTGCPAKPGGDGDSNIENFEEAAAVWAHLTGARFLQGSYTGAATTEPLYIATPIEQAPRNPWGGFLLLGRTDDYLDSLTAPAPRLHLITGANIPVTVMRELDVKVDDSSPISGAFRSARSTGATFGGVGQEGTPSCVTGTAPALIWNIDGGSVGCNGYYLF